MLRTTNPFEGRRQVVTAPAALVVSVADLKEHLRISGSAEDTYLEALIRAATEAAQLYVGRYFLEHGLAYWLDAQAGLDAEWWSGVRQGPIGGIAKRVVELPGIPLVSVDEVTTYTEDGTGTVYSSGSYYVDAVDKNIWGRLILVDGAVWPSNLRDGLAIKIAYTAGYTDTPADLPDWITRGVMMVAAYLYENRGDCDGAKDASCAGAAFFDKYRVRKI